MTMCRDAGAYKTHFKREATPTWTMETYNKHGMVEKVELLRTMTYEEFQFELARSELPLAVVTVDTGPVYEAGTFDNDGEFEAVYHG